MLRENLDLVHDDDDDVNHDIFRRAPTTVVESDAKKKTKNYACGY